MGFVIRSNNCHKSLVYHCAIITIIVFYNKFLYPKAGTVIPSSTGVETVNNFLVQTCNYS